jgi:predicted nucleic acid-binding protein
MTVLIDADAFIALESVNDTLHERAVTLLGRLQNQRVRYYTTWDVVDEVTTKLSYQLSKQHSLSFIQFLEIAQVQIIYPNRERHVQALALFEQIERRHTSLTDCMNMVVASEVSANAIFSFDRVYERQGFMLLTEIVNTQT